MDVAHKLARRERIPEDLDERAVAGEKDSGEGPRVGDLESDEGLARSRDAGDEDEGVFAEGRLDQGHSLGDPGRFRALDAGEGLAFKEEARSLDKAGKRCAGRACPAARIGAPAGGESTDESAQARRRHDLDAVALERVSGHADRDEYGHEAFPAAGGMVIDQELDVGADLIQVGRLRIDAILELDDEYDAVLEDDEVGASSSTAMEFELEDEAEPFGVRAAFGKLTPQDAEAPVPREELRSSRLAREARKLAEEFLLGRVEERADVARPGKGGLRHGNYRIMEYNSVGCRPISASKAAHCNTNPQAKARSLAGAVTLTHILFGYIAPVNPPAGLLPVPGLEDYGLVRFLFEDFESVGHGSVR